MSVDPQPYERVVRALREHGCLLARGCYVRGHKARATCPIHRDVKPSLSVTWDARGAALFCHSCRHSGYEKILAALGLKKADLFAESRIGESWLPATVARYEYADLDGGIIAWKVRREPKSFKWCRPDARGRDGVAWNLNGVRPGLYRWRDLIDCDVVYLTEGEKSANVLWSLGLPATCGPWGAGKWDEQLSMDLYTTGCRELVILPDHDRAGAQHAELVATVTHALKIDIPISVKVALVPGLAKTQNAVDWLGDGARSEEELLAIAGETPVWSPGATARRRQERRRQQSRDLMRLLRAARRRGVDTQPDMHPLTRPPSDIHPLTQVSALAVSTEHVLQVHGKELVPRDDLGTAALESVVGDDLGTLVVVPRDPAPVVPVGRDLRPDEHRHRARRDLPQASARASEPGEWDISSDVLWTEKE